MLNLKKGLRFTDAMRRQLALAASVAALSSENDAFQEKQHAVLLDFCRILDKRHGSPIDVLSENELASWLPAVSEIRLPVEIDGENVLVTLTPHNTMYLPFEVYENIPAYVKTCTKTFQNQVIALAKEFQVFFTARMTAESKIYKFLKGYSSPKMLLGASPEFADFFPEEWLGEETVAENTKSLADILG